MNANSYYGTMFSGQMPQYATLPPRVVDNFQPSADLSVNTAVNPIAMRSFDDNPATLCTIGNEIIGDIVFHIQKAFEALRPIQPPNGSKRTAAEAQCLKAKLRENLQRAIEMTRGLRWVYRKCYELTNDIDMSFTTVQNLIPVAGEWDDKNEERKQTEGYKLAVAERTALEKQVKSINKEIKDIVDLHRRSIWEINCQLSMVRC